MLKRKKKVLIGMSGGVDSSVAACLLKAQGYEVVGVHMKYWADDKGENDHRDAFNKCCTVDSAVKTIYVCSKLKIPLLIFDFRDDFQKQIVKNYLSATAAGLTPNPCVECNRAVKFGLFLEKMKEMGADFVATGHYARIRKVGCGANSSYELLRAKDETKDQSYFLYTLTQEKLRHILFPIGGMRKSEVRACAVRYGLEEINEQKESQNLCFLPNGSREEFLLRHLKKGAMTAGPIIDKHGNVLGSHNGLPLYTIGQRKGIGVGGGRPLYVIGKDREKNALLVGEEQDLYQNSAELKRVTFVSGKPPEKAILGSRARCVINAKIRYRNQGVKAILRIIKTRRSGDIRARVLFKSPQRAVTSGQSVVFYQRKKILGGGIII